jgi:hypothetical protein
MRMFSERFGWKPIDTAPIDQDVALIVTDGGKPYSLNGPFKLRPAGSARARERRLPSRPWLPAQRNDDSPHFPLPSRVMPLVGPTMALRIVLWWHTPAAHVERPHAIGAHVAQRHRLDRFVGAPGCHGAIIGRRALEVPGG